MLVSDGARNMPSWSNAGQVRSAPRSTRQVASVRGGAAAGRRPPGALIQVPLIPELRAERLLLVHVDVVEALAGLVAWYSISASSGPRR